MPNHVAVTLQIIGTITQVAEVRSAIAGPDKLIDFHKLIPRPPSLEISSGPEAEIAKWDHRESLSRDHARWVGEPREVDRQVAKPDILAACVANIHTHGCPTWYEWNLDNWGTKWGAYEQHEISRDKIGFQTANSVPGPILATIAARFPEVKFVVMYADEDHGSNQGTLTYSGGHLESRDELPGDHRSKARRMLSYRMHGYDAATIAEAESDE